MSLLKQYSVSGKKQLDDVPDVFSNFALRITQGNKVAKVEAAHEKRYLKLLESYKNDKTFKGDAPLGWKCRNCGYVHEGEEAPQVCPVCAHPRAYFERKVENY